jgi:hypothetical protein
MADEKRSPSAERPHRSRKRAPPTIDLSATEVKAEEPPAAEPPKPDSAATDRQTTATPNILLKYAGIGASVAAGVVATLAALWFASHLPTGGSASAIRDRLAALEAQVSAKSSAPQPDPQALANLSQRLEKLEQAVSKLPAAAQNNPALDQRLGTIENSMKSLGIAVAALTKRIEDLAATSSAARDRADMAAKAADAVQDRIDALERAAKVTQDKMAQNSGADAAARRALAAFALRDAVVRGSPYTTELAGAKTAGFEGARLGALEAFATTGVPSDAALAREMSALLPKLSETSGAEAAHSGGFMERLQANAGKLVRIHPVGEATGNDASAVLARIEVKAAHNDLAAIASELSKLPPKTRELTDGWSKKLAARDAALTAARDLARDAVAALAAH